MPRALVMTGLASVLLGLGTGWLVGWLDIPELARSMTVAGQASLPAPLNLEVALRLTLAAVGAVAVLLVRHQALDDTYREEMP